MKIKLFLTVAAAFLIAACSKKEDTNLQPAPIIPPTTLVGESNTVYFVDTFRVYSTNLSGGDRKLLIDEDLKSGNNYIGRVSIMPVTNKLVYAYSTGYLNPVMLKIANADGSNKKVLKTFTAGTTINFLKAIAGNKIYCATTINVGGAVANYFFVINEDGSNETEMKGFPMTFTSEAEISNQGIGYISNNNYLVKIKNGLFNETESKIILDALDNVTYGSILANDLSKIAYAAKIGNTNQFEIKVKDITNATSKAIKVYTLTVPADILYPQVKLYWVNGTQNIIAYYGKFTSPKGAVTDYTACELIDVAKGTASNWKFIGDDTQIIVN